MMGGTWYLSARWKPEGRYVKAHYYYACADRDIHLLSGLRSRSDTCGEVRPWAGGSALRDKSDLRAWIDLPEIPHRERRSYSDLV